MYGGGHEYAVVAVAAMIARHATAAAASSVFIEVLGVWVVLVSGKACRSRVDLGRSHPAPGCAPGLLIPIACIVPLAEMAFHRPAENCKWLTCEVLRKCIWASAIPMGCIGNVARSG
jgi:hypothetical protein